VTSASKVLVSRVNVTVEMRPPRDGECGYWVDGDATPEQALASVMAERGYPDDGVFGFGWRAQMDYPEYDAAASGGDRCITIVVREHLVEVQDVVVGVTS
jgi:hypothetical protein